MATTAGDDRRVTADGAGLDGGGVARTRAAAELAEFLAEQGREAEAIGARDDAAALRLLALRLRHLRPEDGHLLALVAWFRATHGVPARREPPG